MTPAPPFSAPFRVADLAARKPTAFDLAPDAAALGAIAAAVGADAIRKLRFRGTLVPQGRHDWMLEAMLGATVVQPCVVSLEPVVTRIDEPVRRSYLRDLPPVAEGEIEMPQDDTVEPLGPVIDPAAVMIEALALAMPLYPRSAQAGPVEAEFAPPGVAPLRAADIRPFAGLEALRAAMNAPPGTEPEPGDTRNGGETDPDPAA